MDTKKLVYTKATKLAPRFCELRRLTLAILLAVGIAITVLAFTVHSGQTLPTEAQALSVDRSYGFIDQERGTTLHIQLDPSRPQNGRFDFASPGVGRFESIGTGVTTKVQGDGSATMQYDGRATLNRGAALDEVFGALSVPSGKSETVSIHFDAKMERDRHTLTAQLSFDGRVYRLDSRTSPRDADKTLAIITDAVARQDWAKLYEQACRPFRARVSRDAFITWIGGDLGALGSVTGVKVVSGPTYASARSGYHLATARLALTLRGKDSTITRMADATLVLDGGQWRFWSFDPVK